MIMKKSVLALLLLLSSVAFAQQADQTLFREAETRFAVADFDLALALYEELVTEFPGSRFVPDAQFRIGQSLYRTGQLDRASTQFDRVARRFRSTRFLPLVDFWRGVIRYELGAFDEAIDLLEEFLSSREAGSEAARDASLYLARSYLGSGDTDQARTVLAALVEDAPPETLPEAVVLLMSILARQQRTEELLELRSRIELETFPDSWASFVVAYEAEAYYLEGSYDQATTLFAEVAGGPPELATLAFQRLFLLAGRGVIEDDPEQIVRRAERELAGRTDVLKQFWLRVAIDRVAEGEYQQAEQYLVRIWELRESLLIDPVVALYLARAREEQGDLAAAIGVLREYLSSYPNRETRRDEILLSLGNLLLREGAEQEALAALEEAAEIARQRDGATTGAGATARTLEAQISYQIALALERAERYDEALSTIDAAIASGNATEYRSRLLRLKSRVLRRLGRTNEALATLSRYIPEAPADAAAALEYMNLLFEQREYRRVVNEAPIVIEALEEQGELTDEREAQFRYLEGLSHLHLEAYRDARGELSSTVSLLEAANAENATLGAYAAYYQAWASYRLGEYQRAVNEFEAYMLRYEDHVLIERAAYLAAWSAFQQNDYERSLEFLSRISGASGDGPLQAEAEFLSGRVLAASGADQQAATVFSRIASSRPDSEFADDALFEYAEALGRLDRPDQAASAYQDVASRYPGSPLSELALFRRGELLFGAGRYEASRDAFLDYRSRFPAGSQADGSLYWGALSSLELGEAAAALLLLDQVVSRFPDSPFRSDAMARSAQLLVDRGQYREALSRFTHLRSTYPETARAINADREIDELVLLLDGIGEVEAELLVTIDESERGSPQRGRAIVELGRLAVYDQISIQTRMSRVVSLLSEAGASPRSEIAQEALFLIGEYHRLEESDQEAAEAYLEAATAGGAAGELTARAIFAAAEAYTRLGRRSEVEALVGQLEQEFPESPFTSQARTLLRGGRQ